MKEVVCILDGKECDLDAKAKGCRRIKPGAWTGQCRLRSVRKRPAMRQWVRAKDKPKE
jgi:hypothetical protein